MLLPDMGVGEVVTLEGLDLEQHLFLHQVLQMGKHGPSSIPVQSLLGGQH